MDVQSNISVNLANLTPAQYEAIHKLLSTAQQTTVETETPTRKRASRTKPEPTVSEEEEESFAAKALSEEDLEDSEEDSDDEDSLSFETVRKAINNFGNRKPDEMKAILHSFNVKSTGELEKAKTKWEPVYRKTMAKWNALKRK